MKLITTIIFIGLINYCFLYECTIRFEAPRGGTDTKTYFLYKTYWGPCHNSDLDLLGCVDHEHRYTTKCCCPQKQAEMDNRLSNLESAREEERKKSRERSMKMNSLNKNLKKRMDTDNVSSEKGCKGLVVSVYKGNDKECDSACFYKGVVMCYRHYRGLYQENLSYDSSNYKYCTYVYKVSPTSNSYIIFHNGADYKDNDLAIYTRESDNVLENSLKVAETKCKKKYTWKWFK
jgi:hypothetical protein